MPTQSINSGRVWRTYLLATLISLTVALAVLLVILASGPTTVQAPGRTFVTPQTYGPPGPSGGFTSLPVVP
jgi:hypothetical protein